MISPISQLSDNKGDSNIEKIDEPEFDQLEQTP